MIKRIMKLGKTYGGPRILAKNISWRFPATTSNIDTIFVVGSPRSGTTLLQKVLSVHSQLFSIQGETGMFSCQNIFDPKRRHFCLSEEQVNRLLNESADVVDFFDKGVRFLSEENENKRFVEKTPQHVLHLPFILKYFPRALIIHIVRDGRDCYRSAISHSRIPQSISVNKFAKYWRKCVSVPIRFKDEDRVFSIRYEDFAHDPENCLNAVMGFIGLDVENNQLDPTRVGDDQRAMRQEFSQLRKPVNTSSVERWRSEMQTDEIVEFQGIAGKELKHYGYDLI